MAEPLRHRQTKGAETDMPSLPPPRHIPTQPTAKVHVIKTFYYMLCQARGVDPLDLQGCYGWQDVLTGKMEGAGGYKYLALWPDGKRQSGSFEVTKAAMEPMDDAKLNVITINISP
jgi:hypothetical protein